MTQDAAHDIVQRQRAFFRNGQTRNVAFRVQQLRILLAAVAVEEEAIIAALKADLNKSRFEGYASEIGMLNEEIRYALRHIRSWTRSKRMPIHLTQFPATARIYPEPYGIALIIAPWNYPFLLIMAPLIGAIAAGNCAILKPSEMAPCTSAVTARIVREHFDPGYIAVVEGGSEEAQALLAQQFDTIFYTGNNAVGKTVMQAAAQFLTPVTLELGGKSPAIVDREVNIEQAARRIVWGKFMNAGQICLSPDYVLVDRRIKSALVECMVQSIRDSYGDDPRLSPDYGRIINPQHFNRLRNLLPANPQEGAIITGGQTDVAERYIAPTIVDHPSLNGALMQEEIFGPLLPVIETDELSDAIAFVNDRPKPLALYFFSTNRAHQQRVLQETSSGGGCINDTILHYTTPILPFGGVGDSGLGKYRGRASFDTFSHQKAFIHKGFLFDFWFRYAPYKNHHRIMKWMM